MTCDGRRVQVDADGRRRTGSRRLPSREPRTDAARRPGSTVSLSPRLNCEPVPAHLRVCPGSTASLSPRLNCESVLPRGTIQNLGVTAPQRSPAPYWEHLMDIPRNCVCVQKKFTGLDYNICLRLLKFNFDFNCVLFFSDSPSMNFNNCSAT